MSVCVWGGGGGGDSGDGGGGHKSIYVNITKAHRKCLAYFMRHQMKLNFWSPKTNTLMDVNGKRV